MAQLAIKGHETRGKEVIEILEMLGGENICQFFGDDVESAYSIEGPNIVAYDIEDICFDELIVFTLEEFLEKFPYKVGDKVKVLANAFCGVFEIQYMEWHCVSKVVKYCILGYWLSAENLQSYKEGTMKEKNNDGWAKWDLPDGYEFQDKEGNVINTDIIKLVKKQPQYPKTYEECCKVMGINSDNYLSIRNFFYDDGDEDTTDYEQDSLGIFDSLWELKICRDAYWKIAGEQMGLGKPWKPNFLNPTKEIRYFLFCTGITIEKG